MRHDRSVIRAAVALLLALAALILAGCAPPTKGGLTVLVDGEAFAGGSIEADKGDGLRIYITLDGKALLDIPFGVPRTVRVIQDGVGENTVAVTEDSVCMAHADCENQDCVDMGAVTRDNLELRVMGGFIVCLPHRLSVEVRSE